MAMHQVDMTVAQANMWCDYLGTGLEALAHYPLTHRITLEMDEEEFQKFCTWSSRSERDFVMSKTPLGLPEEALVAAPDPNGYGWIGIPGDSMTLAERRQRVIDRGVRPRADQEHTITVLVVLKTSGQGDQIHKLARAAARELQLQFKDALVQFDYGIDAVGLAHSALPYGVDVAERIERE